MQLVDRAAQQFRLMMYKSKTKAPINAHVCPAALLVTSAIVADGGRRAVAGAWIPVEERKW